MRLLPRTNTAGSYVEPDWAAIHRELDRKGVTLVLLWQEYQAANAERRTWGYTQFWTHYKAFVRRLKRLMRQHRLAGEKLFIDFAGPTVPLVDGSRAQVFVAAMAASSCVFACATPAQRLEDWVEGIVRALAFYGGVPQLIVPDNPRALIAEPDPYEPRANATVQHLCRYYGCSMLPARPRSPKDKATAESSVQVLTRWVLARLRARYSAAVVREIKRLLLTHLHSIAPSSMLGEALHYLHGQWPKLVRFLDNGTWPLDSNPVENAIRPLVVGRRSWLFADTVDGANASANLYSLIETAKANDIEPYRYLVALFKRLPLAQTVDDYEALLHWNIELGAAKPRCAYRLRHCAQGRG